MLPGCLLRNGRNDATLGLERDLGRGGVADVEANLEVGRARARRGGDREKMHADCTEAGDYDLPMDPVTTSNNAIGYR